MQPAEEAARQAHPREAFTLLDPELFCLDGVQPETAGRLSKKNAMLGISGAARVLAFSGGATLKTAGRVLGPIAGSAFAGMTTASLVKGKKERGEREERLRQAVDLYLTDAGCQWHEYLDDVVCDDLKQRSRVASAVGAAGDYISAGSSFLLMFPPAAAAGFVTGLAIKAGGEAGVQAERKTLKNIYELITRCIVRDLSPKEIDGLWCLLQERGLSAHGGHRLEVWAFCRALEEQEHNRDPNTRDLLLNWLEEQLLVSVDTLCKSDEFEQQCRREFIPALMDGQITISRICAANPSIQRLQVPTYDEGNKRGKTDWVAILQGRLLSELEQVATGTGESTQVTLRKAAKYAMAAAMADFDSASMMAAKIAYRLYIDTSEESEAIACVDEDAYRDCHFVAEPDSIEVMRCGVFKIRSADSDTPTAYIPYLRSVRIPLAADVDRIMEEFKFLSGKWFASPQAAALELPMVGIPTPFVQWRTAPHAFIEAQLSLLAQGLERALATGPDAENALSDYLQMGPTDIETGNRRAFIAPETAERTGETTCDERLAAATFLLQASGYKVNVNALPPDEIELMIAVRQQVLRGAREYLAHVLPASASSSNQRSWSQTVRDEFEASLDGLEGRMLEFIDHLCLKQELS